MSGLNIVSFNVRGIADGIKCKEVFRFLRDRNFDIVCLQETHSDKKKEKIWRNEWAGNIYFSHGETNAKGVCIMFKPRIKPGADPGFDQGGGPQIVTGLKLPFWGLSFVEFWCWGLIFGGQGGGPGPRTPPWIRPCKHNIKGLVRIMRADL